MNKIFAAATLVLVCSFLFAQPENTVVPDALAEIILFQQELNEHYKDTADSPLPFAEIESFSGHEFFPIDMKYRVEADLILTPEATAFEIPTSTARKALYRQYAIAVFTIDSIEYRLSLYESMKLKEKEEYKDYLFLPYKDFTNGFETYGGGRYIDLKIPDGEKIIIDFNQSYNPYCAYSDKYSCPIPPDENSLPGRIEAGVMLKGH